MRVSLTSPDLSAPDRAPSRRRVSVPSRSVGVMDQTHHVIDYIELSVIDLAASRAFYQQAFGWAFNDYGPAYAGIRASSGEGEIGGLGVGRPPGPGGSLVLLFSGDLDATVVAVEAAGGTVTEAPYEFPGGRRFLFTDNSGNELGVWARP